MDLRTVSERVAGIPHMSKAQGRIIFEHLRQSGASRVLEIGTAHGVSAAYMAAAIEEVPSGMVDTLDSVVGARSHNPAAVETIAAAGLGAYVNRIELEYSSYNWWLMRQIAMQTDELGKCHPVYDFCYLDGAHNFTIDGLAFFLIDKLLKPGGWLLLDDLRWTYSSSESAAGVDRVGELPLSDEELYSPQIMPVFDLLVQQHPDYAQFTIQDDNWGWARKLPGVSERTLKIERTESLAATVVRLIKRSSRMSKRVI